MLQPFLHILNSKKIILASGSPRRKEILHNIGLKFEVIPSTYEENLDKRLFPNPWDYVLQTAELKGEEVKDRLLQKGEKPELIISADTVVTMDNQIYEKPKNEEDAFHMLSLLSNRVHTVFTAVILFWRSSDNDMITIRRFYEGTEVQFMQLTEQMIKSYIETKEPMDKAGGYGIQGIGSTIIKRINGDYFNVMGLPISTLCEHLVKLCEE